MDGGITPERPYEIEPELNMNNVMADWPGLNDYEGGTLFIGTKGKAAAVGEDAIRFFCLFPVIMR